MGRHHGVENTACLEQLEGETPISLAA